MSWPGSRRGFSLVEVVIALGVISFALVGILGLFPIAINTAAESKAETRITNIAQSVFTDLQESLPGAATLVTAQTGNFESASVLPLNLAVAGDYYVLYDGEGRPLQPLTSTQWGTAVTVARGVFGVWLKIDPPGGGTTGLSKVSLTIATPVKAMPANRKTYEFVCLLRNK